MQRKEKELVSIRLLKVRLCMIILVVDLHIIPLYQPHQRYNKVKFLDPRSTHLQIKKIYRHSLLLWEEIVFIYNAQILL